MNSSLKLYACRIQESSGNAEKISNALWKTAVLWKDAHPDIPILIVAKSEYARLK